MFALVRRSSAFPHISCYQPNCCLANGFATLISKGGESLVYILLNAYGEWPGLDAVVVWLCASDINAIRFLDAGIWG